MHEIPAADSLGALGRLVPDPPAQKDQPHARFVERSLFASPVPHNAVEPGGRGGRCAPAAQAALAELCEGYWFPLYAYLRPRVGGQHEAQDILQSFFARLLEKNDLAAADPERGRFRAFLLTALKHFLANYRQAQRAQKRGGGQATLSLDFAPGESRLRLNPSMPSLPSAPSSVPGRSRCSTAYWLAVAGNSRAAARKSGSTCSRHF